MNKVFEASSIVGVVFLILATSCAFFFNVKNQKNKSKAQRHEEKKVHIAEEKKDHYYNERLDHMYKEKQRVEEDLEYYKKLQDPLWHSYDPINGEIKVLPGKYGVESDPPHTKGY